MTLSTSQLAQIANYFRDKPVLKAYLFGSYARGEASEASDIDLLVDLDYTQRVGMVFFGMKPDLEKLLQTKVDLLSSNGVSKYIRPNIDSEKQLIYEKRTGR